MPPLKSLTITDSSDKTVGGTTTKVTSMHGKNLTITRTETVVEQDTESVCNMSVVSNSSGSFVSSISTMVAVSDAGLSGSLTQSFNVSEGFGKELVDNVRSRYLASFILNPK